MRDDVVIQKKFTNKLKRQLKKHEKEWAIKIKAYKGFLHLLYVLDIVDDCWKFEGKITTLIREEQQERDKILCVKKRHHRYGRKLGCWLEDEIGDLKIEIRRIKKFESKARYYGQFTNKEKEA